MSSTTMMTRMPIEEETALLYLTKRMKLNSSLEDIKETVSRVNINTKENLAYVLPSLSQEAIDDYFHNGLDVTGRNTNIQQNRSSKKRNYVQMSTEFISQQQHINESNINFDNILSNLPRDKIDEMINEILKLNSKESLKNYLIPIINDNICIKNADGHLDQLKEKIEMIQPQIKSGIENANELNKTLTVTKFAKEKEEYRCCIKMKLSKHARELLAKVSTLKKQIDKEKVNAEEYKRMLTDHQQD